MSEYEYSCQEFETAFKKILKISLKSKDFSPVINPKAYMLGGQPGAGKSILNNYIQKINKGNVIIINGDEYRKFHPYFTEIVEKYNIDFPKYTRNFSSQVTEKLIDVLSDEKYNLCIEGTLRTSEVPINTCKLLKSKEYIVELDIMATKGKISYLSTQLRYYKFLSKSMIARATLKEHHDFVLNSICDNLNIIYKSQTFDSIKVFNRLLDSVYDGKNKDLPGDILSNFYNSSYTGYEIESLKDIIYQLGTYTYQDYSGYLKDMEDI